MIGKSTILAGALVAAGLAQTAFAIEETHEREALRLSGYDALFDVMADAVKRAAAEHPELDETMRAAWVEAADKHLSADAVSDELVPVIAKDMPPQMPVAVIEFYRSDLGRRVNTLEIAMLQMEESALMDAGLRAIEALGSPDNPRIEIYNKMIEARGGVMVGIWKPAFEEHARLSGLSAFGLVLVPAPIDELMNRVFLDGQKEIKKLEHRAFASYAHMYQSLSDEDLEAYHAFIYEPADLVFRYKIATTLKDVYGNRVAAFSAELERLAVR